MKQCLVVLAALFVASTCAQTPIGGDNFGIPLAPQPIPFDKCRFAAFVWGFFL